MAPKRAQGKFLARFFYPHNTLTALTKRTITTKTILHIKKKGGGGDEKISWKRGSRAASVVNYVRGNGCYYCFFPFFYGYGIKSVALPWGGDVICFIVFSFSPLQEIWSYHVSHQFGYHMHARNIFS
ncbi:hypothetical protein HY839_01415 [Candidatus Azambacteria bacterium]|nr:hypothetical protein [Candidatus Azambacteria bacterium]